MQKEQRPNPDQLLNKIQREDEKKHRGHLKIFFGACAGVGKTYALLSNAQSLLAQNIDVMVGIIETHGRRETASLLKDLPVLPLKLMEYKGVTFQEFDLDAALERKPALILIDELAHSNIKGSRHEKRWQDIEELLNKGINVHTTVNVQHLESLNDVVAQITGIHVAESIPDSVFNDADEVTLVDLPPEELLQRFKDGKVYMQEQAPYAVQNFFRKGNLIALRELALRRMTDRVDVQMREYRADQFIERVWQTKERLLVCVGPQENSEKIIRTGARLANDLHADWHAVYIETPALQKLSKKRRDQILKNLKLAEDLGAITTTLAGTDRTSMLIHYAHHYNITKIVLGKSPPRPFFTFWRRNLAEELSHQVTDIDVHIVGQEKIAGKLERSEKTTDSLETKREGYGGYSGAFLLCMVITLISLGLNHYFAFNEPDIVMLYLLGVTLVAIYRGRFPSLFFSFLSVIAFDVFFVEPYGSLTVEHPQSLLTFAIMFFVGVIISNLTSSLRYQVKVATYREQRTQALYALSKELSAALLLPQIIEIACRHLSGIFQLKVMILLPDLQHKVHVEFSADKTHLIAALDLAIAQWVYDNEKTAGWGTQTLPGSPILYVPLCAPTHIRGVLAFEPYQKFLPEQRRLLETFAAQIALALERVHYEEAAKNALLSIVFPKKRDQSGSMPI